jgi:HK97 family phage portal protein
MVANVFGLFNRNRTSPQTTRQEPAVEKRDAPSDPPPSDPWAWALGWSGGFSSSGVEISPQSALEVPAVRAAVDLLAGLMGTLPLNVYKPADNGGSEIVNDHPAVPFIRDDANPWLSACELRTEMTADALLWGAAYALVLRDREGNPAELHRLLPTTVVVTPDPYTQEPTFTVSPNAEKTAQYTWRDVIYVRPTVRIDNLATAGFQTGLAPIKTGRGSIGLAKALEDHAGRLMRNGARPSGILSFKGRPIPAALAAMKNSWQAATSGRASGQAAVLTDEGSWTPLAFTSVDAQFQEMRAFQILEIARLFGIPPVFLQELGRATWNNFEASSREFVKLTLRPWCRYWEAAFRRTLLSDADRKAGLSFGFDLDSLQEGDLVARSTAYSAMIASRVLSPNEAREREGLPSYEGGSAFSNPNTTPAAPPQTKVSPDETGVDGPR